MSVGRVPVYRAKLPAAAQILPYLEIIDGSRNYTNYGELVFLLEQRLRAIIAAPDCDVIAAASGTAALQAAILATAGRATKDRPYALIPSYTFVATAMAAEACGYVPVFADIDAESWAVQAAALLDHPALAKCGVVVPVAPYGRAHSQEEWVRFARRSGVTVAIDAAASFEALLADPAGLTGEIPVAVSFHATKSFSTGEGGAVIWSDKDGLARVAQALNFGFLRSRQSRSAGFNGKMSEYHAAVGLACLDQWKATAESVQNAVHAYRRVAARAGLEDRILTAPFVASNYALFKVETQAEADQVTASLGRAGIEHRFWYGRGVHAEPYFARRKRCLLPGTARIASRLIGIPMYPDIEPETISRIVGVLAGIIGRQPVPNHQYAA
ncbi:DegT/DnrJ/EryC1/StrS family aminotransferase [Acidiphilium sp. AL]|uniref:DegT/DnrJ/EryC1/StrS family aminotransferase n=1 Tax=Acidiphilium iwatense TaxID=768198 RepID=A0ABS9E134_9PROT|nr:MULTISPECIES: DegT/DnrJ/EryC1/StrS family aminotransferase [Acidiphilium]MCF3947636.1 DegT/DnrJ/EryC1/StrS family aminotransferase [Acidiphilium iwatense]MCU4160887.1 DegT/DnrJ/EryC1/StrS family aminotransferase [Acidiphilium sp. AL]